MMAFLRSSMFVTMISITMLSQFASAEMFTSIMDMERALHAEHAIAHDLRSYVAKERERLDKVEQ